jgi:hypothetical protein
MLQAGLGQEARTPRSGVALLAVAVLAAIAILGFISQSFTAGRANETGSPAGKIQDRLHASLTSDGGHEVTSCESGGKPIQVEGGAGHEGFGVANLQPSDGFTNPKLSRIAAPDSRRQTGEKVVPLPKRKPSMAKARTPHKTAKQKNPDKQPLKQTSVDIGNDR